MKLGLGLWNNAITLFGVLLSGVSAILFGTPLGVLVADKAGKGGELLWYFVFALVWGSFALSILIFRMLTEQLSGVRMRFMSKLDKAAGPIMGRRESRERSRPTAAGHGGRRSRWLKTMVVKMSWRSTSCVSRTRISRCFIVRRIPKAPIVE